MKLFHFIKLSALNTLMSLLFYYRPIKQPQLAHVQYLRETEIHSPACHVCQTYVSGLAQTLHKGMYKCLLFLISFFSNLFYKFTKKYCIKIYICHMNKWLDFKNVLQIETKTFTGNGKKADDIASSFLSLEWCIIMIL